jgi:hypothetical protein
MVLNILSFYPFTTKSSKDTKVLDRCDLNFVFFAAFVVKCVSVP